MALDLRSTYSCASTRGLIGSAFASEAFTRATIGS